MNFFRLMRYNFVQNIRGQLARCLMVAGVSLFFFFQFYMDALHIFWSGETLAENVEAFGNRSVSLCDSLLYLTGGMLPVSFAALSDSFQFPVRWLFPHMLILYFTLNVARSDLGKGGIQILTRTRRRGSWWLAKCVWNIATVSVYFAVEFAIWILVSFLLGKSGIEPLNEVLFEGIFNGRLPGQMTAADARKCVLTFVLMPTAVCASVSLLQMTLTLYVKPVFAYLCILTYYVAGIYSAHPFFLSNYALSVRSMAVGLYHFRLGTGVCLCLLLGIFSAIIGGVRIYRMDLLSFD